MDVGSLRFIASLPRLDRDPLAWRDSVRRVEAHGYDAIAVSEHVSGGWQMDAWTGLAVAAGCTESISLVTLVLNNDLHRPAWLAKASATLDVLSGGRFELGIGAGWLAADYSASGVALDSPRTRVDRLVEALEILRLWREGGHVDFAGAHYHVDALEVVPPPTRPEGVPIWLGASLPRMLRLAGERANVVSVHPAMGDHSTQAMVAEIAPETIRAKIAMARDAAAAAGRPAPEIQLTVHDIEIDGLGSRSGWVAEAVDAGVLGKTPASMRGTAQDVADQVAFWASELGVSRWRLGSDSDLAAPVIALLGKGTPTGDVEGGPS
ncbi:LLM class flavin-dependent oxidoreductase [Xylanimonas protaetiae]|uniref:LLM class flavin-dependent oxidoreductase n=1 Tax=Xylanimonas protaetiae TaxID=2509457 RepID=A0A4P6F0N5_9MICO|nr:LLM class flavin-dependent oxidoreductase [Xylanimonas protaetiae]QAY69022.1 LLM class flavin-dependent oxidoreductase [Xylanimonas protaetiae]